MQSRSRILKSTDFGDIDGLFDPNLENYFLDQNYWEEIVRDNTFYVIGRKGTGKSAIYSWLKHTASDYGILISNLSFKQFPFEKLLSLNDENFSAPNQYQSIWRHIILSEFAMLIAMDQDAPFDDNFKKLKQYVEYFFGHDLVDLHKKITEQTNKTNFGLQKILKAECEDAISKQIFNDYSNVTVANRKLEETVIEYLKTSSTNKYHKYIVQFDQLDDNYNQCADKNKHLQCLISLFKTIYDLNQIFRSCNIPAKTIAYLRSDIFYAIHQKDAESARWDDFVYQINWAIISRADWNNPGLLQMLNKRIFASHSELTTRDPFNYIFDNRYINLKDMGKPKKIFRYMIDRSFHRPRDLIQFAKKIQIAANKNKKLDFKTIKDGEREYSLWFLSELENEIGHNFKDIEVLYEFLRLFGKNHFSLSDFKARYVKYKKDIGYEPEELIHLLYDSGIVVNLDTRKRPYEFFSIIRNERSRFNRDLQIGIHRGFWTGLSTTRYMRR